jgi:glycosyltransferase involved in cell wall biosynthesis
MSSEHGTYSGVSVVLPAFNEEANVECALREVSEVARKILTDYEIILVNDGSTDNTGNIVRSLLGELENLRLIEHHPNRGYGGALMAGFVAAEKEFISFFPADKQFHFHEVALLLEKIRGADIVCGYRVDRKDNALRKFFAWGWNVLIRILFGYLCRDVDCGFKLFRKRILEQIAISSGGAMLDTELLVYAKVKGLVIAEVPLQHLPRTEGRATGANARVIARALQDLLQFRQRFATEMRSIRFIS